MTAKVLVVDDDEAIRLLVSRILARRGYDVTSAKDGVEAMALLDQNRFDLVLLDLMMPKADGVTVVDHIVATSDGHRPEIIVMSAAVPAVLARVENGAVRKVMTKPFRVDALLSEAAAALDGKDGSGPPPARPAP